MEETTDTNEDFVYTPKGSPCLESGNPDPYNPQPQSYEGTPMMGETICWIAPRIEGVVTGYHGYCQGFRVNSNPQATMPIRTRAREHYWWVLLPDGRHIVLKRTPLSSKRIWRTLTELRKEPERYYYMYGQYPCGNNQTVTIAPPHPPENDFGLTFEPS